MIVEADPLAEYINDCGMRVRTRDGRLLCGKCGRPATRGWVYKFGEITVATCGTHVPADPAYVEGCVFTDLPRTAAAGA